MRHFNHYEFNDSMFRIYLHHYLYHFHVFIFVWSEISSTSVPTSDCIICLSSSSYPTPGHCHCLSDPTFDRQGVCLIQIGSSLFRHLVTQRDPLHFSRGWSTILGGQRSDQWIWILIQSSLFRHLVAWRDPLHVSRGRSTFSRSQRFRNSHHDSRLQVQETSTFIARLPRVCLNFANVGWFLF